MKQNDLSNVDNLKYTLKNNNDAYQKCNENEDDDEDGYL